MLLSIREAATHLGISADTVRRRIRADALGAHKQDGRWRVEIGDADALGNALGNAQAPADAPGQAQDTSGLIETLTAQLAMKDQQIERLHTLLMQTALAPALAEHKPRPWWRPW